MTRNHLDGGAGWCQTIVLIQTDGFSCLRCIAVVGDASVDSKIWRPCQWCQTNDVWHTMVGTCQGVLCDILGILDRTVFHGQRIDAYQKRLDHIVCTLLPMAGADRIGEYVWIGAVDCGDDLSVAGWRTEI